MSAYYKRTTLAALTPRLPFSANYSFQKEKWKTRKNPSDA